MNKNRKLVNRFSHYLLAVASLCVLTNLFLDGGNVHALTTDQKIQGAIADKCFRISLNSSVDYTTYNFDRTGGWYALMDGDGLPLSLYTSGRVSQTNCYNFLKNNYNGKSPDAAMSPEAFNNYMTNLGGYKQDKNYESAGDNSGNKVCKVFNFKDEYGNVATSNTVCLTNTLNGTSTVTTSIEATGNGPLKDFEPGLINGNNHSVKVCSSDWNDKETKPEECKKVTISSALNVNAETELDNLGTQLKNLGYREICNVYSSKSDNKQCGKLEVVSGTSTTAGGGRFIKQNGQSLDFVSNLLGATVSNSSDLRLSKEEERTIALGYLDNFYDWGKDCTSDASPGDGAIKISSNGETCYVWARKNKDEKVPWWASDIMNGVQSAYFKEVVALVEEVNNNNDDIEKCRTAGENRRKTFQNAIDHGACNDPNSSVCKTYKDKLKELDEISKSSNGNYTVTTNGVTTCAELPAATGGGTTQEDVEFNQWESSGDQTDTDPGNVDDGTNVCFASAGVLGWIVCPVLQALGKAVDGLYKNVVEDFIQIEAEYMTSGGSAHQAWTTFRNFANLIFAAAFVIVILSQITGIGLSNYNIKKMLPRLIVVVIMVNASFFLCQVAVDLSNILGYSLERFFSNLANGFEEASMSVAGIASGIIGTLFGGAAIVGGVAVAAATWEFWLIPLIIAFVSAIIGIIFFFIVLAVRKAGVLLLVALTPVAIACYALPNTKSLFDKWQKAFIGLLVAYPICGMLMGGGKWLSALLLSQNSNDNGENVFMKLVAMLLQVVPFFFIPGIIRGSLTAMGNIGNRISGFGNNFSRQAANSFRRSELARDMQHGIDRAAYDSVGALGRSRAGQFIANSRLGKFVGGTRIGKWAGDRHATRQAVRKSRLAGRYNFIEKERMKAAASTGNQLLRPGSEAYDNEMRNLTKAQQKLDIASQEARYNDGVGLDKDPASIGEDESWFDVNDDSSKAREYGIQLRQLQKDIASGADYTKTLNNVKALQNIMSKTDAGRSAIQNQLLKMISGQITDGSLAADGKESALSLAAAHLNGEHANTIKQSNRGLSKMVQDLAGKKYSNFSSNDIIATDLGGDADKFGQRNIEYHSKTYSAKGIDGYNAESLANADDGALDRMIRGLQNNEFEGKDVQTLASLANEALIANEKGELQIKEENKNRLRNIIRGAYSANAVAQSQIGAGGTTTTTAGSNALNGASANALHSLAAQIRNGNVTGIEASKIVSNLTAAAKDSSVTHNESWVDAANEVMAAANAKNIKQIDRIDQVNNTEQVTLSGNDVADHVDAANVRFEQDYTPVQIDPTLSTATANDVRAAVEQAKAQFDANHQNHSIATNADIQAALNLARISNPNATVNDLAFKVGDVIEKVTNTNGVTHYHTVSSAVADDFRAGPKKTADFGVGDVIRTDNTSGTPVYTRVSDAEAADYHARNKHNSEVKIQQERRQHKNQPQPSPSPSPTATS